MKARKEEENGPRAERWKTNQLKSSRKSKSDCWLFQSIRRERETSDGSIDDLHSMNVTLCILQQSKIRTFKEKSISISRSLSSGFHFWSSQNKNLLKCQTHIDEWREKKKSEANLVKLLSSQMKNEERENVFVFMRRLAGFSGIYFSLPKQDLNKLPSACKFNFGNVSVGNDPTWTIWGIQGRIASNFNWIQANECFTR